MAPAFKQVTDFLIQDK